MHTDSTAHGPDYLPTLETCRSNREAQLRDPKGDLKRSLAEHTVNSDAPYAEIRALLGHVGMAHLLPDDPSNGACG